MVTLSAQVVISTGKSDWDKEVTNTSGSLAAYLSDATGGNGKKRSESDSKSKGDSAPADDASAKKVSVKGVFNQTDSTRLGILNGSHRSLSDESTRESVIVLPDYKFVTEVERSQDGAIALWNSTLAPQLGRAGSIREGSQLKTWTLPYSCLILLCTCSIRTLVSDVL